MNLVIHILTILVFIETIGQAQSTCYCPLVCTRYGSADGHVFCVRSGRAHCPDTEAHEECRAALLETTDMINSIGSLATSFLTLTHEEEGEITAVQAAYLRTKLSEAFELEHKKPVPDCEVGLNTNTLAKGSRSDLCFSAELFDQCKFVQDRIDDYSTGIASDLERLVLYDPEAIVLNITTEVERNETYISLRAAKEFIKVIERRGALTTANIRCAAYEATLIEISAGRGFPPTSLILFLAVTVMTIGAASSY